MKIDVMQIEILADGTIRAVTDPISGANHQSADEFLKAVDRLAFGETRKPPRERRKDARSHTHDHTHDHTHQH